MEIQQAMRIIVPLVAAALLLLTFYLTQFTYNHIRRRNRLDYRARFRRIIYLFEQSTAICNQLEKQTKELESEKKLLNYYLGTLGVLETLLQTVKGLDSHRGDPESLNTALYLAQDLHQRCLRVQTAFQDFKAKKAVNYDALFSQKKPGYLDVIGCYFCSRPYKADFFSHVKVKVQDNVLDVFACRICEQELVHTKSVRILSFKQDGKSVHWSKIKGYQPSSEYWHLNLRRSKDLVRQRPQLQIVKSDKMSGSQPPNNI